LGELSLFSRAVFDQFGRILGQLAAQQAQLLSVGSQQLDLSVDQEILHQPFEPLA
jgi:hypothetical protein